MNISIRQILQDLKTSFFVYPAILVISAIGLSYLVVSFDETSRGAAVAQWLPMPKMQVDGARSIVVTIASGMITVAALVFSLTFVAISQLSQQLGPRILLSFMKDAVTKTTLGVFLAIFVYALLVLSTIGSGENWDFVPLLSVYLACMLAVVAFGFMVFFVHHIARTMQADVVVAGLGEDLAGAFDRLVRASQRNGSEFSAKASEKAHAEIVGRIRDGEHLAIDSPATGYIQVIDLHEAARIARDGDMEIAFLHRPGHFVLAGSAVAVATMRPRDGQDDRPDDDELCDQLRATFAVGELRTPAQEAEFETNALIEVALRALSPGVNDPFTAIACIDQLTGGLSRLIGTDTLPFVLHDEDGNPRVFPYPQDFAHFMKTAFHPLRDAAKSNPLVLIHLTGALLLLHRQAGEGERRPIVAHAEDIWKDAQAHIGNATDLNLVHRRLTPILGQD